MDNNKIIECRKLIESGEKIYRACDKVGISLSDWYRYGNKSRQSCERFIRFNKLVAARSKLRTRLEHLDIKISSILKEISNE